MDEIYIVICDDKVSQEGYSTTEKAIEFILGRSGNPQKVEDLKYIADSENKYNVYVIKPIVIK